MQQDDQNTFKFTTMNNQSEALSTSYDKCSNHKSNIISKINIIKEGINFIVPSFWYQELKQFNANVKSVEQIRFPPFQFMTQFLRLHALQKYTQFLYLSPSESLFQINQRYSAISTSFLTDFLQQSNFNWSKTLKFSKLNDTQECNEIQWSLINPYMWNLIENRIHISQVEKQSINQEIKQHKHEQISFEQLSRLHVMLRKEFILQKHQSRTNQRIDRNNIQSIEIYYKRKKYLINHKDLQNQINNQLRILSPQQTNFLLIIDEALQNYSLELKKLCVSGFFPQNMGFKQLVKSLIQMGSKKKQQQINDKFYIYDQNGHKINTKINTISSLNELSKSKQIIVSTLPIQSISERKIGLKNCLRSLISSIQNDQNGRNENNSQDGKNQKNKNLQEIHNFLNKKSKQIEFKKLKQNIMNIEKETLENQQQPIRSGFKPYNKPFGQSNFELSSTKIQIQASYHLEKDVVVNEIQNQDDFRLIQSLTTNMDTPVQQQSQSQRQSSQSYVNKKLHRHAKYNRQQRRRKSQSYLQKKKKNNVILKDNSSNNKEKGTQHKKRVKHSLFQSLACLDRQNDTLSFLLDNMKFIAKETTFSPENQLIGHPYAKQKNISDSEEENVQPQGKEDKKSNEWLIKHKKDKQSQTINKTQQSMLQSLQQIASMIQQKYQPHSTQKQSLQQFQKIELYQSQYENQLMMKKDNEEIKTIVDNSQGPYSQIEKHQVRKYRTSEKKLEKNQVEIDDVNSLTDGIVNYLEYNQETL